MKIVFDTNVLVAEALGSRRVASVIDACIRAKFRILTSQYILDELERVLVEKLSKARRLGRLASVQVSLRSIIVDPGLPRHRVPSDAADDAILQTALIAGADYLVTDDRHLLDLHPYETIKIVSLGTFIEILKADGHL